MIRCRGAVTGLLLATALMGGSPTNAAAPIAGQTLPPWQPGMLDIHHIHTGRGDALLFVLPDGTSLLNDAAGRRVEQAPFSVPTRPDASRAPGEWIARYVRRALPAGAQGLDYALLSHFHGDHIGVVDSGSPASGHGGDYRLAGITEVAEHVPIARLIDRAWPDYRAPGVPDNPTMANYQRFIRWQGQQRGLVVERFEPGRNDQIVLRHQPAAWPQFELRNLYADGRLWNPADERVTDLLPAAARDGSQPGIDENQRSIAFRLRYGRFDYFSGGDLSSPHAQLRAGAPAWLDVETPVARASGPVDVLKANHHGSWDANSPGFLAALQPRAIVVTARADGHPAVNTYLRMRSTLLWPGPRDIFITHLSAATAATTYGVADAAAGGGHILVRVAPGGGSYRIVVLDDSDEAMRVKAVAGPYPAR